MKVWFPTRSWQKFRKVEDDMLFGEYVYMTINGRRCTGLFMLKPVGEKHEVSIYWVWHNDRCSSPEAYPDLHLEPAELVEYDKLLNKHFFNDTPYPQRFFVLVEKMFRNAMSKEEDAYGGQT